MKYNVQGKVFFSLLEAFVAPSMKINSNHLLQLRVYKGRTQIENSNI